jgi:hypothetical protein
MKIYYAKQKNNSISYANILHDEYRIVNLVSVSIYMKECTENVSLTCRATSIFFFEGSEKLKSLTNNCK